MKNSERIILQNFPHNAEYNDESFLGTLHEDKMWDQKKYKELIDSIDELSAQYKGENIPRDIAWPIVRIFSHVMLLIQAHYNKDDLSSIKDITPEQLQEFREDFQISVESFFSNGFD